MFYNPWARKDYSCPRPASKTRYASFELFRVIESCSAPRIEGNWTKRNTVSIFKWNSTVRDWVQGSTIHFMIHYMKCLTMKRFCIIMADTADKNEACISCCKCSLEYLSAACNRTPLCVDWGRNGWVAYGACHSIALWLPKVRSLNTVLMFLCCLLVPRALMEMNSLR